MNKLDLYGKKFGKLTVIAKVDNIPAKDKTKRSFTAWECRCDCGKVLKVRTGTLTSNQQESCGCIPGTAIEPNQKFGRLTALSYSKGYWNCICDCGENTIVLTHKLISGNTKSCGCLRADTNGQSLKTITKFEPRITSARRRWKSYLYQDEQCDIPFETFLEIVVHDCFYCGVSPYSSFNYFLKKKDASQHARDNGDFVSHGLDRIDNSKAHIIGNVVPCCAICNRAKTNRSIESFYSYIETLRISEFTTVELIDLPEKDISVKSSYSDYVRNFSGMEIDLKTFYSYSQQPCFYCGALRVNSRNARVGADTLYLYNGVDRMDSSKGHTIDNIVPCCKYCNFGNNNFSFAEFNQWIIRIKEYNEQKINNRAV